VSEDNNKRYRRRARTRRGKQSKEVPRKKRQGGDCTGTASRGRCAEGSIFSRERDERTIKVRGAEA